MSSTQSSAFDFLYEAIQHETERPGRALLGDWTWVARVAYELGKDAGRLQAYAAMREEREYVKWEDVKDERD